jgi:hypothetical protein
MFGLTTPRQAIGEIFKAKVKPKRADEFKAHLEQSLAARGLLDMHMTASAIDGLMREEGEKFFGPRLAYRSGAH